MQTLGYLSLIAFSTLTVGLLTERYLFGRRVKRHKEIAATSRFDDLTDKLYRCETNEQLADFRQSMLFTLCVEDYTDNRYAELLVVLGKQEAAINNDFLTLRQIRIVEGNKMINACMN